MIICPRCNGRRTVFDTRTNKVPAVTICYECQGSGRRMTLEQHDGRGLIIVVGRGHSGTRAIAHTLYASGVHIGGNLNVAGDLVPALSMYDAARLCARSVKWRGGLDWDFRDLHTQPIPPIFGALVAHYLASVLNSNNAHRGWKLPETTLVLPWIVRLFPAARYIYWTRDPRDCILGDHITDDLINFGVSYEPTPIADVRRMRAISWFYQYEIMRSTPRPANVIDVRFEDFVLDQPATLARLEGFLGIPLARIVVRPEAVGRHNHADGITCFDFLKPAMRQLGYPCEI